MTTNMFTVSKSSRLHTDTCHFWDEHQDILPGLAMMARDFLSSPAAEAGTERTFNFAGEACGKRRRFVPATVSAMMKCWHYDSQILNHQLVHYEELLKSHNEAIFRRWTHGEVFEDDGEAQLESTSQEEAQRQREVEAAIDDRAYLSDVEEQFDVIRRGIEQEKRRPFPVEATADDDDPFDLPEDTEYGVDENDTYEQRVPVLKPHVRSANDIDSDSAVEPDQIDIRRSENKFAVLADDGADEEALIETMDPQRESVDRRNDENDEDISMADTEANPSTSGDGSSRRQKGKKRPRSETTAGRGMVMDLRSARMQNRRTPSRR